MEHRLSLILVRTVHREAELKTVADVLATIPKRTQIVCVRPDMTVMDALNKMTAANLSAVVVQEGARLVGVFSDRDVARRVTLKGRKPQETKIGEVMTTEVFSVSQDVSAEECLSLMNRRGVRHLPVTRPNGDVVGCVSILEIVDAVLAERDSTINHLEKYVSETWPI